MNDFFIDTLNITSLEEATQLLKECQEGFFKLFDTSPVGMSMTTTGERTFVRANPKFLETFGHHEEDILGKTSLEVGIVDQDGYNAISQSLKDKGKLQNYILKCYSKEGTVLYNVFSFEIIELNGINFVISSFLDVTNMVHQQNIIERQNKDILDSINYARLIQNALLPSQSQVEELLPQSFILSKPRDILSGDFYWLKKVDNRLYVAACDCTGHGVPGALISIVGFKLLSKFTAEYNLCKPSDILNQLNKEFALNNHFGKETPQEMKDGMDISLCTIDFDTMTMEYAGAYNPIYLVRNGELIKLAVDKIPIHLFTDHIGGEFNNYSVPVQKDDCLYLFSDGYADQFGGPYGKKFQSKQFQELVLKVHALPMEEQKEVFNTTIEKWKNESGHEQTDDILVVGFKL